jgi:predicted acetyltransferase
MLTAGYALVPAGLTAPEGLADLLMEVGESTDGFGGELAFVRGEKDLSELLQSLVDAERGIGLPENWVPCTTSWLIDPDGSVVGMARLRHSLTPFLLDKGGNIGYFVKRSERGKGLGTFVLRETLALARRLGLERVMIAAYSSNAASIRVIEANGGVFDDEREAEGHRYRRYWVELS